MSRLALALPAALLVVLLLTLGGAYIFRWMGDSIDRAGVVDRSAADEYRRPPLAAHDELIAFVGRQLALVEVRPPPTIDALARRFDLEYRARFQILDLVYGEYESPEIDFEVYSHDQIPPWFTRYEHVLIYVSRYEDRWIHQKYQYDPVYPVSGGGWASCGTPHESRREPSRYLSGPVEFDPPVLIDLNRYEDEKLEVRFAPGDLIRRGEKGLCVRGASAETLFAIKRDGVLKSRGVFD